MKNNRVESIIKSSAKLLIAVWTVLIASLVIVLYFQQHNFTERVAKVEARANFNKDKALRLWLSKQGGIYVPVSSSITPSVHLSHIPHRDIVVPNGKKLTLMNPAYVIRKVHENAIELYGEIGSITSLKPIQEINAPDDWERYALLKFEHGAEEVNEFVKKNGSESLRLMQPLLVKDSCLKCHAHQGYKVGDVRGGVAVSLVMDKLRENQYHILFVQFGLLIVIWGVGIAFILFQSSLLEKRDRDRTTALKNLEDERERFVQGPVMTFSWQNLPDWPVEHVSSNVAKILGYSTTDFLSGTVKYSSIIHLDDVKRVVDEVVTNSAPGTEFFVHEPYRLTCKQGSEVWVLDHTNIIRENGSDLIVGYSGYLLDITDLMGVKSELLQRNREFALVESAMNLGTWDWNINSGETIFNKRWAEIIGYTLEELQPMSIDTWQKCAHPKDLLKSDKLLKEYWSGKTDFYRFKSRMLHKDGKIVWVLTTGITIEWNDDKTPKRMIGTHLDITDQVESYEIVKKTQERAEHSNKVKTVFLNNVGHELRTPLNSILGYAQILLEDETLNVEQKKRIDTIYSSSEQLHKLVNEIFEISELESKKLELNREEFEVASFFNELTSGIEVKAKDKGLNFVYEVNGAEPLTFISDRVKLKQIIYSLLSNGVKFTDEGECLFLVRYEPVATDRVKLSVSVKDSGIGIAKEDHQAIFEPFYKKEELQYSEGTGLGLTICKKLIKLFGGEIKVESGSGGSQFSFSVELLATFTAKKKDDRDKNQNIQQSSSANSKKILIVDDNRSNVAVLRDVLLSFGYDVDEVYDGSEVYDGCIRFNPDLIIMDLRMPKVNGYVATEQLRSSQDYSKIPVIALSATNISEVEVEQFCNTHSFDGYLSKPFSFEKMRAVISKLITS